MNNIPKEAIKEDFDIESWIEKQLTDKNGLISFNIQKLRKMGKCIDSLFLLDECKRLYEKIQGIETCPKEDREKYVNGLRFFFRYCNG